tara:strand:- start:103 stop:255 length:153 start_codon:yes stop_codon:yes gene_type:complete
MKQKIAFFIDTSQTSGVALSEVVYMLIKLEQILNIVEKNSKIKNSWLFKN